MIIPLGIVAGLHHYSLMAGKGVDVRYAIFSITAAVAAFVASTAAGASAAGVNYTTYSDERLQAELDAKMKADTVDWCGEMQPLTRQMEARGSFGDRIAMLAVYSDMVCSFNEERWGDAFRWMTLLEQKSGVRLDYPLSVVIPQKAGRLDVAEARYLAIVDTANVGGVTREQGVFIWDLARSYAKAKQPELRIAFFRKLVDPSRLEKFHVLTGEAIGSELFRWEAEAGHMDAARALLPRITSPRIFLSALGDRRFAPLWPDIEARAGKNMATVINALVERRTAWFDADRNNREALKELADAYLYAGRFDDILSLVSPREPPEADYSALTEDMSWALGTKIRALDALGRHEEAGALFDRIAAIDPGDGKGWVVGLVINRAIRLADLGKADDALVAIDLADAIAKDYGNDYARMLLRRTRICALAGAGRQTEAKALLEEAIANSADSPSSAVQAMLCAGADDEAARVASAMLGDSVQAGDIIDDMQSPEFALDANRSVLPSTAVKLRNRPDVAPLFQKVARDIPHAFVPLFSIRRSAIQSAGSTG